jgi:putative cell wall-binding protein
MKPFPLEKLLRVREHREQLALQLVNEHKAALGARLAEVQAVRDKLTAVENEERMLIERMATSKAVTNSVGLAGIDARRALLRDKKVVINEELKEAQDALEEARQTLARSIHAYRQARAMKDSAVVQRDRWHVQEQQISERRDETAAEELTASQYTVAEQ